MTTPSKPDLVALAERLRKADVERFPWLSFCHEVADDLESLASQPSLYEAGQKMAPITDDQIKYMVDRFLRWRLPEHFNPDCGISFDQKYRSEHGPVGTNLFDATQATAMVHHMIEGMPTTIAALPADSGEEKSSDGVFDECGATGQSCIYAGDGPNNEFQCIYCGKPGPSEATPSTAGSVREALKGMLRLFDDQGNLVSDFQQLQIAIEAGYAALSVLARSEK